MNYRLIYLSIILILGMIAILCFFYFKRHKRQSRARVKTRSKSFFRNYINSKNYKKDVDELMIQSGSKITVVQYQLLRHIIFIVLVVITIISYLILESSQLINNLFLLAILFIFTSPTTYFLGKKTPFKVVMDFFVVSYKKKLNKEIYLSISQIKNLAISRKKSSISSDLVLEQIAQFTKNTRSIFNKLIALWSLNKKEEGCKYFESTIGTKEAEGLANIFRKLDSLVPSELYNQIILLQETIKKERETAKITANENKSNLVYLIVIITSFIIMVNFVVIVYYLEFLKQLQFLQ